MRRVWSTSAICLFFRHHGDCGGVIWGSPFTNRCQCKCHNNEEEEGAMKARLTVATHTGETLTSSSLPVEWEFDKNGRMSYRPTENLREATFSIHTTGEGGIALFNESLELVFVHDIQTVYKGDTFVVHFSQRCPHCGQEMP